MCVRMNESFRTRIGAYASVNSSLLLPLRLLMLLLSLQLPLPMRGVTPGASDVPTGYWWMMTTIKCGAKTNQRRLPLNIQPYDVKASLAFFGYKHRHELRDPTSDAITRCVIRW
jgi:hypothetical protein